VRHHIALHLKRSVGDEQDLEQERGDMAYMGKKNSDGIFFSIAMCVISSGLNRACTLTLMFLLSRGPDDDKFLF
jgi:hypothetical protein